MRWFVTNTSTQSLILSKHYSTQYENIVTRRLQVLCTKNKICQSGLLKRRSEDSTLISRNKISRNCLTSHKATIKNRYIVICRPTLKFLQRSRNLNHFLVHSNFNSIPFNARHSCQSRNYQIIILIYTWRRLGNFSIQMMQRLIWMFNWIQTRARNKVQVWPLRNGSTQADHSIVQSQDEFEGGLTLFDLGRSRNRT